MFFCSRRFDQQKIEKPTKINENKIAFKKQINKTDFRHFKRYKNIPGGSSSPHRGSSSPHRGSMFRKCHVRTDAARGSRINTRCKFIKKVVMGASIYRCVAHTIPLWARLDNSTPHRLERLEVQLEDAMGQELHPRYFSAGSDWLVATLRSWS